jgi:hypothetical protein
MRALSVFSVRRLIQQKKGRKEVAEGSATFLYLPFFPSSVEKSPPAAL